MRVLTSLILASFAVLSGCGTTSGRPDGGTPDAGPADAGLDAGPAQTCLPDGVDAGLPDGGWDGGFDFSCRGRVATLGGQAELAITGTVTRAGFTRTPLAEIQVDLLRADGAVLASTTSDDAGSYRLTFDAGCEPVGGEVRATHPPSDAGFVVSYSVPPAPWIRDRAGLEMVMFDSSTSALVAALAGVTISDGGVVALHVTDCEGNPVAGAVVSTAGDAGTIRYVGANGVPSSMLAATSTSGDVLIFNLPGDRVDVSATLDGGVIGSRIVPIHAGAVSGTTLVP